MTRYTTRLDKFRITNTRALHKDTDYVSLTAGLGDPPVQTVFANMYVGDVNNGDHKVNIQIGPMADAPGDILKFGYVIINHG